MALAHLKWLPNPPEEEVTSYNVYLDGAPVGTVPASLTPSFDVEILPGIHAFIVAPVNLWEEGPQSDPLRTPPVASKPGGLSISITVSVSVG
jgi:hypothetical protein